MRRSCWFYKVLSNKVLTYIYDLILPLSETPLGTIIHLFRTATEVIFKKVFLKISKHSQGNTFVRVFSLIQLLFNKTLLKRRLWHRCFPVNYVKLLKAPFLQNTSGRLLLFIISPCRTEYLKNSFFLCHK